MVFNDELLFLHVPKTAGMAVSEALMASLKPPVIHAVQAGHAGETVAGVRVLAGRRHQNLATVDAWFEDAAMPHRVAGFHHILVMVRNPYAMELSRYHYLRKGHAWDQGRAQELALDGDYAAFVDGSRWWFDFRDYYTVDGAVPDNLRIVRQEDYAATLALTCGDSLAQPLQVREMNRSHSLDYREVMDAELEQAIYRKYQWIFDKGFYPRERYATGAR
ncbi:MAG: hypothetical protein RIC38_15650 [Chromatocurvus sp.]